MERVWQALVQPFTDPASRTWWVGLVVAALIALGWSLARGRLDLRGALRALVQPSSRLDVQLLLGRQLLRALGALPALGGGWWLATRLVRGLDGWLGAPDCSLPPALVTLLYSVTLFVVWDLSRYVVHRLMHVVPALWAIHQVHHSAEVLTPLTFHRVHPVESLIYGVRELLVTGGLAGLFFWAFREDAVQWTVLGVHGGALLLNVATGNLRHSHVWMRFGAAERWLVSPAQHQLHHAVDGDRVNYGTWLAVWDRWAGTWQAADATPPERFGIRDRNHGDDLVSAWLGPVRAWFGGAVLGVVVATGGVAHAQDPDADPEGPALDDEDDIIEIVVEDGPLPRVAGSAYQVDEATLEQFEHDDIHAVLGEVPGVYVRGEDGFGLRPNIGIRGGNADRSAKVTLLEDGVLFAPAPYAAPAAYYFPMVTRMVGVEVFKGPASIQHGPHTIGGAINLQTRAVPRAWSGAVDLAGGLRSTGKAHAWVGGGGERWGVLLEGVGLTTQGFKQLDGGGPTGFARGEGMLKLRWTTDPARRVVTGVRAKLGWARELSHETYLGLSVDDHAATPYRRYAASQLARMAWQRTHAQVTWPLVIGAVQIRTTAYRSGLERTWTKLNRFADGPDLHDLLLTSGSGGSAGVFRAVLSGAEDSAGPEQVLQIGTNDRGFLATGVDSRVRWASAGEHLASRFEAGVRVHHDRVDRLHTEEPHDMRSGTLVAAGPPETLVDSRATALALAAYAHEDLQIAGRWHVVPGLRVEHIRARYAGKQAGAPVDTGIMPTTVLLPGLGLLGQLSDGLAVFTGVHRGFSPVSPSAAGPAPAEVSWNLEVGARAAWPGGRAELVAFGSDYSNLTAQCTTSSGCLDDLVAQQFDAGRAVVYGAEAMVAHEVLLPAGWSVPLAASYTRTETRFREDFSSPFPQWGQVSAGAALPYVPRDQGSVQASLAHRRARLGVAWRARGPLLDRAHAWPATAADVPALHTVDVSVDVSFGSHVTAYAVGTNVGNAQSVVSWRPFGARPVAPFQIMAGVKLRTDRER